VPNQFRVHRGRAAVLTRYRDPADPELLDARQRMREEAFLEAIGRALAKAPPLDERLRQRALALLFVDAEHAAHAEEAE
jgi:hypothetical protein